MIAPGGVGTKPLDTSLTAAVLVAAGQNLKGDARPASRLCAGLTPLLASKACQQHFIICAECSRACPQLCRSHLFAGAALCCVRCKQLAALQLHGCTF